MGWIHYNDSIEPSNIDPRKTAVLIVVVTVMWLGNCSYELWRDWHRHHVSWNHIIGCLVGLYWVGLIGWAAWQAWHKVRRRDATSKTV